MIACYIYYHFVAKHRTTEQRMTSKVEMERM